MSLNRSALIDKTYFEQMWQGEDIVPDRLENLINAVSASIEKFCNRPLVRHSYTYVEVEEDTGNNIYYIPEYTIFDAPPKNILWMPTYPVSVISYIEISGVELSASTGYTADDGYILYDRTGKLVYDYGFDYPYRQNVKVKWTGGYADNSAEMSHLRYLCFLAIKDIINAPQNMTYESEKIGQYSYKTVPTYFLKSLQGLSPKVFSDLSKYRREAIG